MVKDRKSKGEHGVIETVVVKRDGIEVEINKCDASKEKKKGVEKEGKKGKD